MLTGCYLLECADLDEAVRWAEQLSAAWGGGTVEVRPVIDSVPPAAESGTHAPLVRLVRDEGAGARHPGADHRVADGGARRRGRRGAARAGDLAPGGRAIT